MGVKGIKYLLPPSFLKIRRDIKKWIINTVEIMEWRILQIIVL